MAKLGNFSEPKVEVSRFLTKLAANLFGDDEQAGLFIEAICSGQADRPGIIWLSKRLEPLPFETLPRPAWLPDFADIVAKGERPGLHPGHDQGAFYCLDASSIFCGLIVRGCMQNPELVLDVCASPGGKAIATWRMLKPVRLICNEVIGKRSAQLISNIRRCSIDGAEVTRDDSSILAEKYAGACNLVIVDAPCSGQSLLARGKKSPGCFHVATVNMNSNRQKRILANSAKTVASGGFLAYMTCTYSPKENEDVIKWFIKKFPNFQSVQVPAYAKYQSELSSLSAYRMFPQAGEGAGGFCCLLQRQDG